MAQKLKTTQKAIIDLAGGLYRRWQPSHGVDINDAILAATAMKTGDLIP